MSIFAVWSENWYFGGMPTEEEKQTGLQLLLEKQLKHEYLWHDL